MSYYARKNCDLTILAVHKEKKERADKNETPTEIKPKMREEGREKERNIKRKRHKIRWRQYKQRTESEKHITRNERKKKKETLNKKTQGNVAIQRDLQDRSGEQMNSGEPRRSNELFSLTKIDEEWIFSIFLSKRSEIPHLTNIDERQRGSHVRKVEIHREDLREKRDIYSSRMRIYPLTIIHRGRKRRNYHSTLSNTNNDEESSSKNARDCSAEYVWARETRDTPT